MFTAVLVVVAILQWLVFTRQLDAMRKDQRAWIAESDLSPLPFVAGQPLRFTWNVRNTGKSPAKNVEGKFYDEVVPNGGPQPHFDPSDTAADRFFTGVLMPNASLDVHPIRLKTAQNGAIVPVPLSEAEKNSLAVQQAWVAIYGRIDFEDIFKTKHWVKFCFPYFPGPDLYTYMSCTRYNKMDDN